MITRGTTPFRKSPKTPDDYKKNLWMAIEDIWTEMYATYEMSPPEIRARINSDVKFYIDEMQDFAYKDLHGLSAHKRRKLR